MRPLARGFVWAALAALSFGVTTPLIRMAGENTGPWTTAGLLYAGAALFAALAYPHPARALRTLRGHLRLLVAIAVVGGMLAPAAFVFGLHATSAVSASLALNMEAPFSVLIAALAFREYVGGRLILAMVAIVAGSALLSVGGGPAPWGGGVLWVIVATALWSVDNALSSLLADVDARVTVFWKSALGALLSFGAALVLREAAPAAGTAAILLGIGAVGYGASLFCYLSAQRIFGIGRTASVFASAPFIGAALALLLGEQGGGWPVVLAFALIAGGVVLHATERHAHLHAHHPLEHDHLHKHDDGHHDHSHGDPGATPHTHQHRHRALVHGHEHAPDPHHAHSHTH
jgi:drug/metabolite transporter (DMT)-like permease